MIMRFSDPFEALLQFQRQLDARFASDWLGKSTASMGAYPPSTSFNRGTISLLSLSFQGWRKTIWQ